MARPEVSAQVCGDEHVTVDAELVQVTRHVPFLSLSWYPSAQLSQAVPVYPVEQVQVLFRHVPCPPHDVVLLQSMGARMHTPLVI